MAVALTVAHKPAIQYTSVTTDVVTKEAQYQLPIYNKSFTEGTGADQLNKFYWGNHDIANGVPLDLDLAGGLTDPLGDVITFTKIKYIRIWNKDATNTLLVGAGSNPIVSLFGAGGDIIKIPPGGQLELTAPGATAFAVVATTGDILRLDASAGTIDTDITIGGVG